jgi:hypothetical protein
MEAQSEQRGALSQSREGKRDAHYAAACLSPHLSADLSIRLAPFRG